MSELDEITLVTAPAIDLLNERQLTDYRGQRADCLRWLLHFGKDPDHVEGYAFETVRARANRMDRFYRCVWKTEDQYVAAPTHDHADAYMESIGL